MEAKWPEMSGKADGNEGSRQRRQLINFNARYQHNADRSKDPDLRILHNPENLLQPHPPIHHTRQRNPSS